MTVRQLLRECDSRELVEWYAYHQRWPLGDGWEQTARTCRVIMSASGNYKQVPSERVFIPSSLRAKQSQEEMLEELRKLQKG